MSRRPEYKPNDYRYQEEIDKSWDPKLEHGNDFWVFNQKTGRVWGGHANLVTTHTWVQSGGENLTPRSASRPATAKVRWFVGQSK